MAEAPADSLVTWYRAHARALPWRADPTPYHVLLSELMCQQTRVETVLPYFERFVARWPTLEAFAAATDDEVLGAWAGLGYYRRARNLLAAARQATALGGLPSEVEALRGLPGIGPYTAGAIASIAFGRAEPAIDGNVERVISRVAGLESDPRSAAGRRAIRRQVERLLESAPPSALNQALMELGATVCTPRRTRCDACPWSSACVARAEGRVAELPRTAPRRRPVEVRGVAGLCARDGALLLGKRPEGGLLGGLWEPIGADEIGAARDAVALVDAFEQRTGLAVERVVPVGEVVHVFTHRRLTLSVFAVEVGGGEPAAAGGYDDVRWVGITAADLRRGATAPVALSTLARKVLRLAVERPQLALPLAAEGGGDPYGSSSRRDVGQTSG